MCGDPLARCGLEILRLRVSGGGGVLALMSVPRAHHYDHCKYEEEDEENDQEE